MSSKQVKALEASSLLRKIRRVYPTTWIDDLLQIPGVRVLVFGGFVRDILLGRPWKDLDVRVLLNTPWDERERAVERQLKKSVRIQDKIRFTENRFTVYRFLPPRSKSKDAVDVSLAPTIRDARSDFTINDIFVDLQTGEVLDRHGGISDLQRRQLHTVAPPKRQLKEEPWMLLRAVKVACHFDFRIHPQAWAAIQQHAPLIRSQLAFVASARKGLWVEVLQGNTFRGLEYDAHTYFDLFVRSGFLREFIVFLQKELGGEWRTPARPKMLFKKGSHLPLEKSLSLFLSFVSRQAIHQNPRQIFGRVKHLLALDRNGQYQELPVRHAAVRYTD